ncbi:hypothetical protein Tco_0586318 [Tanacetum coccineum]
MRTRSQARRRRQPQVRQTSVESSNLEKPDNPPIVTMADNRTMAQLLEAPTEGYEDAIVIPEITANNFEIKHGLLNLVQKPKQFFLAMIKKGPTCYILKMPRECLKIIESKSEVTSIKNKAVVAKMVTSSSTKQSHPMFFYFRFWTLPGNTVYQPEGSFKRYHYRSGVTIQGPNAVNHDVEFRDLALPLLGLLIAKICSLTYNLNWKDKDKIERIGKMFMKARLPFVLARKPSHSTLDQTSQYTAGLPTVDGQRKSTSSDMLVMSILKWSRIFKCDREWHPTPYFGLLFLTAFSTLTPFGERDFLLLVKQNRFLL